VRSFKSFLEQLPPRAPNWVRGASCHWTAAGTVGDLQELKVLVAAVCKLEGIIQSWLDSGDPTLISLQNEEHLATLVENGKLTRSTVQVLQNICCASEDKQPELLYLLLQPKDFIIRPSNSIGPDIIGFLGVFGLLLDVTDFCRI
jgi:hypothetical protein